MWLENFFSGICRHVITYLLFSAYPSTSAHASTQGIHPQNRINPGEEKIIAFPQKNDPKFTIHLKMGRGSAAASPTMMSPNSGQWSYNQWAEWDAVNGFGFTVISYRVSVDFYYDGTDVINMTSPPHESAYHAWGFNITHNASSTMHRSYGVALGNFQATGPFQTINGYVEVVVEGNGSSYGYTS